VPTRLRLPQIEQRPKKVHRAKSYRDIVGLDKRPDLAKAIVTIVRNIENGTPLPHGYYRSGIGHTPDELLEIDGIMHLHLGHPGTRELLFLIQYSDHVLLLEVSDHAHFADDPPGTVLKALHEHKVRAQEAELETARKREADELRERVRGGLKGDASP
jgi:hypothetical protein